MQQTLNSTPPLGTEPCCEPPVIAVLNLSNSENFYPPVCSIGATIYDATRTLREREMHSGRDVIQASHRVADVARFVAARSYSLTRGRLVRHFYPPIEDSTKVLLQFNDKRSECCAKMDVVLVVFFVVLSVQRFDRRKDLNCLSINSDYRSPDIDIVMIFFTDPLASLLIRGMAREHSDKRIPPAGP